MTTIDKDIASGLRSLLADESLYSVSNGILGMRGSIAEGVPSDVSSHPGLYLNGVYTTYPYQYGEKGIGFPDRGQVIVNLPRADGIHAVIDGVVLNAANASLLGSSRNLDPHTGIVSRTSVYEWNNHRFTVVDRRIAGYQQPHLIVMEYTVSTDTYDGEIEFVSTLNPNVSNYTSSHDPRVLEHRQAFFDVIEQNQRHLHIRIRHTNQNVHLSFKHNENWDQTLEGNVMIARSTMHLTPSHPVSTTKYVVVTSDVHHINPHHQNRTVLAEVGTSSIDDHALDRSPPITMETEGDLDQKVQFNLFHLERNAPSSDHLNIPAKGLSGEGYEGHYFWDTEMYMVPYFLFTDPMQAKRLLLHRYHGLDHARQEARNLGHQRGAKYPWRTINGTEASPYFPAGSAQYHINAIIAYQFIQYHLLTNDEAFLLEYGFEVLYETAQIYLEIGHHTDDGFEILGVTGPDEYTALVDNNYYTNSMAQYHMEHLVRFFEQYQARLRPGFDPNVIQECHNAAKHMVLRFDSKRNIHPQDDSFLRKKPVDLATWKRPLLLHYHPMTIYRHQVCKQADVIASYLLLDNVPDDIMRDSLNYYEQVTTHDSSLSKCIFSIQHLRVGQQDIGEAYFHEQLQIDFDNTYGNTGHGLHLANMGGTYLVLLLGFLGLRWNSEGLAIRPKLPSGVRRMKAPIHYRGGMVAFDITPSRITIETDRTVLVQVDGTDYLVQERTSIPRS